MDQRRVRYEVDTTRQSCTIPLGVISERQDDDAGVFGGRARDVLPVRLVEEHQQRDAESPLDVGLRAHRRGAAGAGLWRGRRRGRDLQPLADADVGLLDEGLLEQASARRRWLRALRLQVSWSSSTTACASTARATSASRGWGNGRYSCWPPAWPVDPWSREASGRQAAGLAAPSGGSAAAPPSSTRMAKWAYPSCRVSSRSGYSQLEKIGSLLVYPFPLRATLKAESSSAAPPRTAQHLVIRPCGARARVRARRCRPAHIDGAR